MSALGLTRFAKYALIGSGTLGMDLILLFLATSIAGVPYQISTPVAFLIAVSINYFVSRHFVFIGTERPIQHGYAYFVLIAVGGAVVITASVTALVTYLHLYYLFARILVAAFVGMGNYLFNLYFNFKVAGKHTLRSVPLPDTGITRNLGVDGVIGRDLNETA